MAVADLPGFPDLARVRAWVGVPAASIPDQELQEILAGEADEQERVLIFGDDGVYPPALVRALLRRVQRQVAARAVPLGMVGDAGGEFGAAYLRAWDPEVRRLEDPYRAQVVA